MPNWIGINLYIRGNKEDLQKVKENLLITDAWRKEVAERNAKITPKMVVNGKEIGNGNVRKFHLSCDEKYHPNGTIDFNRIVPTPLGIFQGDIGRKEMERYGVENCWYGWNVANWGTSKNAQESICEDIDDETYYINFWTAWTFPEKLLKEFNSRCLEYNCTIDGEYADEDLGGFMGIFHTQDDELYVTTETENTDIYQQVWHDDEFEDWC